MNIQDNDTGYSEYTVKVRVVTVLEREYTVTVPHTVDSDDREGAAESKAIELAYGDNLSDSWTVMDTDDYETRDINLEREYNATCPNCGDELGDDSLCHNGMCSNYDGGELSYRYDCDGYNDMMANYD